MGPPQQRHGSGGALLVVLLMFFATNVPTALPRAQPPDSTRLRDTHEQDGWNESQSRTKRIRLSAMSGRPPIEETTVTTLEAPETYSLTWQIANVTLQRIVGAPADTMSARSATFSALGHDWHLVSNFNWVVEDPSENCCAIRLNLDTPNATVNLELDFTCGGFEFGLVPQTWSTVVPEPAATVNDFGSLSLTHAMLSANPGDFIIDGVLTVKATLNAIGLVGAAIGPVKQLMTNSAAVAQPSLGADMRQALVGTARGCPFDVKLLCADGERVPAHSLVLALRSGVFSAMFASDSGLAVVDREGIPVPPEITSATLRRILEFVYTDELTPASAEEAQHLLNAADVYQLPRLKSICERTLCEQLSVQNAGFTLALASQHHAGALEREAILFATRNAAAVLATEGWAHLSAQAPKLKDRIILAFATGAAPPAASEASGEGAAAGATAAGAAGAGGSGSNKRARRNR